MASRRDFLKNAAKAGLGLTVLPSCATTIVRKINSATRENYFEYIIIGSGAGGGPLAANLARRKKKVLLLEAGPRSIGKTVKIPAFHALASEEKHISWNYFVKHYKDESRQRKDSKYVDGKGILYPRAATLGGCTAHNAMITMYPDNQDFDDIVTLTGDKSWNSNDMRSYFQRLERCQYRNRKLPVSIPVGPTVVTRFVDNPSRSGFDGWLPTDTTETGTLLKLLKNDPRLLAMVLASVKEEGVANELVDFLKNKTIDPNHWRYLTGKKGGENRKTEGVFNIPKATLKGQRYGVREYLEGTENDPTYGSYLTIRSGCLVEKIIMNGNRAIGVRYRDGSFDETASFYQASPHFSRAAYGESSVEEVMCSEKGEVIVCAGAFNSPQLLMLSGIGDPEYLKTNCKVPLPGVGKNLQDRYELGVVSKLNGMFSTLEECRFEISQSDPCYQDYIVDPKNSLYGSNGVVIGLIKRSHPENQKPDLIIFGVPGDFRGYKPGYSKQATSTPDHFTWCILKGHTANTAGEVLLNVENPTDPTAPPEINFNYFDEGNDKTGNDLAAMVKGIEIARKINSKGPLKKIIEEEVFPGRDKVGNKLAESIVNESWGHHASCSNKMGRLEKDKFAVVDSNFRVHKTQGLRIVDASVFPKIPGFFIVLPIYMIAEKATDVILKDAEKRA